jgi:UDP-N-acetylmuramate: L-alanyl-gamma-D-glutamyl-meso-diaminopimelate ligase
MQKKIHFIGICGVAMSALAIAFHKKGYTVTGSDKGFYPPVSTYLKKTGITYYPGWHPEKMTATGNPDLVVVGNVAGSKNPEWLFVQEHNIPYKSYPEVLAEFFIKKTSIVCAGTYGKTTSSSLLTWIFTQAGHDPSYMFGGISQNDMPAAALTDSEYSILEGDEYKTARWDTKAKFFHYSPTHLLLTSVAWDHADVYPTEQSYDDAFQSLVSNVPETGQLVISEKVLQEKPAVLKIKQASMITYGKSDHNDYQYTDVTMSKTGITFSILHKDDTFEIHSPELGDYMADNMTGCFALAHQLGLAPEKIIPAIESFKSIKRRLEKRLEGDIYIFDDIAHSPKKAEATLQSLQKTFEGNIIAIFEPNSGNRQAESLPGYDNKFTSANTVIIPRLSKIKHAPNTPVPKDGQALANYISKTHPNVLYIEDDDALVEKIKKIAHKGDAIVFLGSHGFRGMIEGVVEGVKI